MAAVKDELSAATAGVLADELRRAWPSFPHDRFVDGIGDALAPLAFSGRVELLAKLRKLPADWVLVDLGAGTHPSVMDYFLVGDDGILVLTPEPTSVENAYAFLRAAFYRRLRLAMTNEATRKLVTQAMDQGNERGIRTPLDLLRVVREISAAEGERPPSRTVLALDVSLSMKGEPLHQVIRSVDRLLDALGPEDELGIVAFSENASRVVEPVRVDAAGKRLVRSRVGRLRAGSGTNIEAGLDRSAEMLATTPAGMRRGVVLLSDGALGGDSPSGFLPALRRAAGVSMP